MTYERYAVSRSPTFVKVIHKLSTGKSTPLKVIHKLSTSYPQAEANVCSAGRGRGANACSSRRVPKRFLQIFKTRVIISYRIALSIVLQSYPTYPQRHPTSSKLIILQLNVSLRYPTYSKAIQSQSIRISN